MTKKEYVELWKQPAYVQLVEFMAASVHADGCSGVPDFYLLGCLEHDVAYRAHIDPFGNPITKEEADRRFRWYIQMRSPFGVFSPMSWWRWWGVRMFGNKSWKK